MDAEEQAVFYRELMQRGIVMFAAPKELQESGLTTIVQKVFTTIDERTDFDGANSTKAFQSEEEAIEFVKTYIQWSFAAKPQEVLIVKPEEIRSYCFVAHMLMDVGFGPQNVELGRLASDCLSDNWQEDLQQHAESLACKYLESEFPERDIDLIKRQVKVLPTAH